MTQFTTAQARSLRRAVYQYGEQLRIEPKKRTVFTLQGREETGWIVWGRAHGGDEVGSVFPSRQDAETAIALASSSDNSTDY
jgi:hypothetical protein